MALRIGTTLSRMLGANRPRERAALGQRLEALLTVPGSAGLPSAVRGHAMLQCAEALNTQPQASAERAQQAADWLQTAGDTKGQYVALCVLARALSRLADMDRLAPVMATIDALEDPNWPAAPRVIAASVRSGWHSLLHDAEGERHWMYRTAALLREAGRSDVAPLVNLIGIERRAGHLAEAIALGEQVLARTPDSREPLVRAHTWVNLCSAQVEHGDLAAARQSLARGWPLVRQFNLHPNWADNAGLLAAHEGRVGPALALWAFADQAYAALGGRREASEQAALDSVMTAATDRLAALGPAGAASTWRAQGWALNDAQLVDMALALPAG
jgi:hypothetical protein